MKMRLYLAAAVPGGMAIGRRELGPTLLGGLDFRLGGEEAVARIERLLLGCSPRMITIFACGNESVSCTEGKLSYACQCFECQSKVVDVEERSRLQIASLEKGSEGAHM